jgi:hypothetical protein
MNRLVLQNDRVEHHFIPVLKPGRNLAGTAEAGGCRRRPSAAAVRSCVWWLNGQEMTRRPLVMSSSEFRGNALLRDGRCRTPQCSDQRWVLRCPLFWLPKEGSTLH